MQTREVPGCEGCPWRGPNPFVPDELVEGAPLMAYFQNPGLEESEQGKPLVGKTGQVMERGFFPLAGVQRGEVSLGNAVRCRLGGSNKVPDLSKDKVAQAAVQHCTRAHHRLPSGTKAILAAGEYAAYALSGLVKGFSEWRGYAVPYTKGEWKMPTSVWTPTPHDTPILVSNHIAYMFRVPSAQVAMKADWRKWPRLANREWPTRFPRIQTEPPEVWPKVGAFDTEYDPSTGRLLRYSLANPNREVWVVEAGDVGQVSIPPGSQVIGHNVAVDTPYLAKIIPIHEVRLDDSMYLDSVLWSTFPHDLNYLGSLYGRTNRHKHLVHTNPIQYSGGDALHTMDVWEELWKQAQRDPQSKWVYEHEQRPLLPIILKAKLKGSRVDQARVKVAVEAMRAQQQAITRQAQASVGWPINVGSNQQVGDWLYRVEGLR